MWQLTQKLLLEKKSPPIPKETLKKKRVQILTLVLRSHKFCAFLTVSYSSAASKPDSLAFFWGRKLRVSQGIPSWLPPESGCCSSPSIAQPSSPAGARRGESEGLQAEGSKLVALQQLPKQFCSEALYYSFSTPTCLLEHLCHLNQISSTALPPTLGHTRPRIHFCCIPLPSSYL